MSGTYGQTLVSRAKKELWKGLFGLDRSLKGLESTWNLGFACQVRARRRLLDCLCEVKALEAEIKLERATFGA